MSSLSEDAGDQMSFSERPLLHQGGADEAEASQSPAERFLNTAQLLRRKSSISANEKPMDGRKASSLLMYTLNPGNALEALRRKSAGGMGNRVLPVDNEGTPLNPSGNGELHEEVMEMLAGRSLFLFFSTNPARVFFAKVCFF